ncbi:SRPBCC family protein [Yinghuangia soli]|uniref:SRPBCC family protein n=1 Tax=Yinghuangia soli TaxID=2908204 RepID=A0AA41Q7X0_9ACTN|nr:SRPBCC family protein [Yinghuangia soli]MCF2532014.1 SRPBCC family protein [Yinghuangia soli]
MTESQVFVERRVAASPDRVWQVLTDLAGAADTLSGVSTVEVLTPEPFGVGTRWRETRKMFGKEASEEMRITACEPPHRYVANADSHGMHYVTEFTVVPDTEGTSVLRMTFGATPAGAKPGVFHKLFAKLGAKAVAKTMRQDLADIAAKAERPTAT